MSEYQYYEFAAIDGPISDEGLRYARACSSRANVSRVRWQNTYHFGSFGGSVDTLLKYYDAHFYIANWGTVRLGLAFPKGAIAPEVLQPYLRGGEKYEDSLSVKEIGERCIVYWERNEEGGWWETNGDGIIDQLIGIREELLRADYRALFLGWLADFDPDEWGDPKDGGVMMPPIPAGLDHLSSSLETLIRHFPFDTDSLAVAARLSQASTSNRIPLAAALETLSVSEMRTMLTRVAATRCLPSLAERQTRTNAQPSKGSEARRSSYSVQSSTRRPSTLRKSARLRDSKRASWEIAVAAILRSMVPTRVLA